MVDRQLCGIIPQTDSHYGVIFALDGRINIEMERLRLSPKKLSMAVIHAMQYEEGFIQFGATGHVVDLVTGLEVDFDRNALLNGNRFVIL